MLVKGKSVLITGGCSGLGASVVRLLNANDTKIVIADINDKQGTLDASTFKNVEYMHCNVANSNDVENVINFAIEKHGKLDIIVNTAGVNRPQKLVGKHGPCDIQNWLDVLTINLVGTFYFMRLGAAAMQKNEPNEDGERGVIISTSSVAAFHGEPGQTAYSAAKSGINGMMLPAAREFAKYGIRFMAIAPSMFDTAIFESTSPKVLESLKERLVFPHRIGNPEEFANAVKMIIENIMFNGDVIRLDGAVRF